MSNERLRSLLNHGIGYEEGDICNRDGCLGSIYIEYGFDGGCSCFNCSPCSWCESTFNECSECGWSDND